MDKLLRLNKKLYFSSCQHISLKHMFFECFLITALFFICRVQYLNVLNRRKGVNKNLCIDNAALGHEKWVGNLGFILLMSPKLTKVKSAPWCMWRILFRESRNGLSWKQRERSSSSNVLPDQAA